VLGGTEIGEDFSGYGPARFFAAAQVVDLAAALAKAEPDAAARYDPERMTRLQIYPFGWDEAGREWILDSFRKLLGFYADAASSGYAVVTCLV
jgi:hypothetical protein